MISVLSCALATECGTGDASRPKRDTWFIAVLVTGSNAVRDGVNSREGHSAATFQEKTVRFEVTWEAALIYIRDTPT